MAKSPNQKKKLIYLMDKFMQDTDENHGITVNQMIEFLGTYDIHAERKSIYEDIDTLCACGMDIVREKSGGKTYYKLVSRQFELAELKLLVDAVQAAKFVTVEKTNELIGKLGTLASRYEAGELKRQVHVLNRVKNPNERIYISVDALHRAINNQVQVEFQYAAWNLKKELNPKHGGKLYQVSPWALIWDDENYYLIGFDEEEKKIKHFRVDKMLSLVETEKERHGKELFESFDMATYSKKTFGMYGGTEQTVSIRAKNYMAGVIIDRFGKEVMLRPEKNGTHFIVNVDVAVSSQFLGWIVGIGTDVEILAPQNVRNELKEYLEEMRKMYS